jgi:hypothetical protein
MRLLSTRRQRKQNPQRARNPGGRSVHVRTPVRHDSIGGIRSVTSAPVAHNGVIRDAGRDRDRVDRDHKAVGRREGVHAGYAPELQLARSKDGNLNHVPARLTERDR